MPWLTWMVEQHRDAEVEGDECFQSTALKFLAGLELGNGYELCSWVLQLRQPDWHSIILRLRCVILCNVYLQIEDIAQVAFTVLPFIMMSVVKFNDWATSWCYVICQFGSYFTSKCFLSFYCLTLLIKPLPLGENPHQKHEKPTETGRARRHNYYRSTCQSIQVCAKCGIWHAP